MKILFVTHDSNYFGANRSLVNLMEGLKRYNHEFFVITGTDGELVEVLIDMKVECKIVPFTNFVGRVPKIFVDVYFLLRILKKWWRIYSIWSRNRILVKKTSIELKNREFDVVYSNTSVIDFGLAVSKKLRLPHVLHIREAFDLHFGWKCWYGDHYFSKVLSKSTRLIANSNFIKEHFESKLLTRKNFEVVYNGVFFRDSCKPLSASLTDKKKYDFLLLGSLSRSKGHEDAINALSIVKQKFPKARLIIMGAGSITFFQTLADRLKISKSVIFHDYQNDPSSVIADAFALLNCSRNEGMGRVTVEAMLLGTPVIGLNSGGTSEIIEYGRTGLLYNSGFQDLANNMMQLIRQDELYRSIRENARDYAYKSFSIDLYAEKINDILKVN